MLFAKNNYQAKYLTLKKTSIKINLHPITKKYHRKNTT